MVLWRQVIVNGAILRQMIKALKYKTLSALVAGKRWYQNHDKLHMLILKCNCIVFPMMLSCMLHYRLTLLPSHFEFCECTDIVLVTTKRRGISQQKKSAW